MDRPPKLICASLMVCEFVLRDEDGVFSSIRQIDIFYVRGIPNLPLSEQSVQMQALFHAKFNDIDGSKHIVGFDLVRPDGTVTHIGEPQEMTLQAVKDLPVEVPRGISIGLRIGVAPSQLGVHYLIAYIDGLEVTRLPFMILEAQVKLEQ